MKATLSLVVRIMLATLSLYFFVRTPFSSVVSTVIATLSLVLRISSICDSDIVACSAHYDSDIVALIVVRAPLSFSVTHTQPFRRIAAVTRHGRSRPPMCDSGSMPFGEG